MVGVSILKYDCKWFFRSYHDEEHYNSVRLKEDPSGGPARPIIIKVFFFFLLLFQTNCYYNSNGCEHLLVGNILISCSLWKVDVDLSATAHQPKAAVTPSKGGTGEDIIHAGSIKMVMGGTGCQDAEKVKQVILTCLICFCAFFSSCTTAVSVDADILTFYLLVFLDCMEFWDILVVLMSDFRTSIWWCWPRNRASDSRTRSRRVLGANWFTPWSVRYFLW